MILVKYYTDIRQPEVGLNFQTYLPIVFLHYLAERKKHETSVVFFTVFGQQKS